MVIAEPLARTAPALVVAGNLTPALGMGLYLSELSETSRATVRSALRSCLRGGGVAGTTAELGDAAQRLPWHQLSYAALMGLRAWCVAHWSASRCNVVVAAIRGAARHGFLLDEIDAAQLTRVEKALRSVRTPSKPKAGREVTAAERDALLRSCEGVIGARDAALFALLYAGIRVSAAARLDVADLTLQPRIQVRVTTKRGKVRDVPLVKGSRTIIDRWLTARGDVAGPLVCRVRRGGHVELSRMTRAGIRSALRARGRVAGIEAITPHDLRRTVIGDGIDATRDIAAVQRFVGHDSVATTGDYDRRGRRAVEAVADSLMLPAHRFDEGELVEC